MFKNIISFIIIVKYDSNEISQEDTNYKISIELFFYIYIYKLYSYLLAILIKNNL